jgi:hypothetical protein
MTGRRPILGLALLAAALVTVPAAPAAPTPAGELDAARAAQAQTTRRYRESLDAVLPLNEAAAARAAAEADRLRGLVARGLVAAVQVEAAERALVEARAQADRTRAAMREADALVADAEAARELASLPPPAPGETQERPSLIRFGGRGGWSLASLPSLERFFVARFGHPLPISALGQTAAHDRLGFDHRNALDVAVHPDSAEGRALLGYLRANAIPFLAFRAARTGIATGAHVHVGEPSGRL